MTWTHLEMPKKVASGQFFYGRVPQKLRIVWEIKHPNKSITKHFSIVPQETTRNVHKVTRSEALLEEEFSFIEQ